MKVIIAGSRNINDYEKVKKAINESGYEIGEIVSGKAKGIDTLGEKYAKECGIPVIEFPAKWNIFGKRAGFVRNLDMARYADALIAIWDGKSKGTKNMILTAKENGLKVHILYDVDKIGFESLLD